MRRKDGFAVLFLLLCVFEEVIGHFLRERVSECNKISLKNKLIIDKVNNIVYNNEWQFSKLTDALSIRFGNQAGKRCKEDKMIRSKIRKSILLVAMAAMYLLSACGGSTQPASSSSEQAEPCAQELIKYGAKKAK